MDAVNFKCKNNSICCDFNSDKCLKSDKTLKWKNMCENIT